MRRRLSGVCGTAGSADALPVSAEGRYWYSDSARLGGALAKRERRREGERMSESETVGANEEEDEEAALGSACWARSAWSCAYCSAVTPAGRAAGAEGDVEVDGGAALSAVSAGGAAERIVVAAGASGALCASRRKKEAESTLESSLRLILRI